jgi:hypothetical protein
MRVGCRRSDRAVIGVDRVRGKVLIFFRWCEQNKERSDRAPEHHAGGSKPR